ncbi:MAG: hypothetical protein Cons2KO_15720 [Congregibacter sp.]
MSESEKSDESPNVSGKTDASYQRELRAEDQARVDEFLKKGVNSVERKPFRPFVLLIILIGVVASLSFFSQWLAREAGVF